jgi:hypothetical protein
MTFALQFSLRGDAVSYLWTGIIVLFILAIAFPLAMNEEKVVKRRWQRVSDYIEKHRQDLRIRPLLFRRDGDIVLPAFSGFLIHGNFDYVCLDSAQARDKVLAFVDGLKRVCLTNNSWHFDFFAGRFYTWLYHRKAARLLACH